MLKLLSQRFALILLVSLVSVAASWGEDSSNSATYELSELTVRPEAGQSSLPDASTPATVLDSDSIATLGAYHFQDITSIAPNLTWAGGTSRPRYFQMRGIGERSQFANEGPPNFSVGFLVDDMDFSGVGMHASLFDVQTVEILRGPQAAIYGSKALAGLVSITTSEPTSHPEARTQITVGNDELYSVGAAISGPVLASPETLTARISVEKSEQNGFRDNTYLGRDDTNGRDELTLRGKLRWKPSSDWQWDLTTLFSEYDNGYDIWAPDNNGFKTYTDDPGRDYQESVGASLRGTWLGPDDYRLVLISSYVETDSIYSYDADWANNSYWAAAPYFWNSAAEGYDYDFSETLDRTRRNFNQDLRLISEPGGEIFGGTTAWNVGLFASQLTESDSYEGFSALESDYEATSAAVYGQLSTRLCDTLVLRSSLRVEERWTDYTDGNDIDFDGSDTMWGGRLALESKINKSVMVFGSVSRGFKGSGVNQNPALAPELRSYDAETLWSFETGAHALLLDDRLDATLTFFYMLRDDLQINTSIQDDPTDPGAFTYFTDNAAKGVNYGVEAEATHQLCNSVQLFGSLSLLQSEFNDFKAAGGVNLLEDRDQPYAPQYSFSAGAQYTHEKGLFARVTVEGKDAFYLSDSHDHKSSPYELLHLRAGYSRNNWTLTFWGRNVLDEEYVVRGYYFGLTPPNYDENLWLAYGDPVQFGVTLDCFF
jgi:iron complex outermembrane receptor protein